MVAVSGVLGEQDELSACTVVQVIEGEERVTAMVVGWGGQIGISSDDLIEWILPSDQLIAAGKSERENPGRLQYWPWGWSTGIYLNNKGKGAWFAKKKKKTHKECLAGKGKESGLQISEWQMQKSFKESEDGVKWSRTISLDMKWNEGAQLS